MPHWKMIVRKLQLLILNQMWSIQIFQSHYSVNLRLSQNLSGISKILETTIFSTKILHVYCMWNVIIPERFRICYLASESCDFHVISHQDIYSHSMCNLYLYWVTLNETYIFITGYNHIKSSQLADVFITRIIHELWKV